MMRSKNRSAIVQRMMFVLLSQGEKESGGGPRGLSLASSSRPSSMDGEPPVSADLERE